MISLSWLSFLNPFKKKKEPSAFPNKFALIRYSDSAKEKGRFDEETKIIEIYKNGEKVDEQPYTKELVDALEEIDEMPVEEEVFKEEPFEFQEVANFGSTQFRR